MRIERENPLGKAEAVKRIDSFVEELMGSQLPGGVQITDADKQWSGDTMAFSFKASKGFLGASISGSVAVSDDAIVLDSELPSLVDRFVGEDKIKDVINHHLDNLLSK